MMRVKTQMEYRLVSRNARHKELLAQFKQSHPEPGVYRIVNSQNGKSLLGVTPNLASIRNKLEFAKNCKMPGALDLRLKEDIAQNGIDTFFLEVLEVLETRPEMTPAEIHADLAVLEALWREKLDGSPLY